MTDDPWKRLLPLLRQREPIAQGEMWSEYYDYVFGYLLKLAPRPHDDHLARVLDILDDQGRQPRKHSPRKLCHVNHDRS